MPVALLLIGAATNDFAQNRLGVPPSLSRAKLFFFYFGFRTFNIPERLGTRRIKRRVLGFKRSLLQFLSCVLGALEASLEPCGAPLVVCRRRTTL